MFGNNCSARNLRAIHPARPWPTPIRLAKSVFAGAMLVLMVVQGAAIVVSNENTDGFVVIDAVQLLPVK